VNRERMRLTVSAVTVDLLEPKMPLFVPQQVYAYRGD
jgi:hypothetical protein